MTTGIVDQGWLQSTRNPFSYEKVIQLDRDITTGWLTLDEITNQLNLFEDESQDVYLTALELATRMAIEDYLGLSIFPITYKVFYGNATAINTQVFLDLPEITQGTGGVDIESVSFYNNDSATIEVPLATSA